MTTANFWDTISRQLVELRQARTASDVLRVLATADNPYGDPHISSAPAFFAGSGGDETVQGALSAAGWARTWAEASYYYTMTAPDGTAIKYIEGDVYPA